MGRAISKLKHPLRDFNVETRAHKVISEPPKPAPKHTKDNADLKRLKEEYSKEFEESLKKNEQLDKNLKNVFVTSRDPSVEYKTLENPLKPLPQDRKQSGPFLFGHKEPDTIPFGKTTLRNVLEFISQHQNDPKKYSISFIAQEYKISEEAVAKLIQYYKVFEIYMPSIETKTRATFAGPAKERFIVKDARKQLEAATRKGKDDDT